MASIFTKIVNGEIPCYKVAETEDCLAFLDINPLAKGHTLVIPKKEVDYLFDVDDALYAKLFAFAKKVAHAIKATVPCERVGVAVIGLEVPHAHVHLCPINSIGDLSFSNPRVKLTKEEFQELAKAIAANYKAQPLKSVIASEARAKQSPAKFTIYHAGAELRKE